MADDIASKIEAEYKEGLQYQKVMGFNTKWPEWERMKSGDQWPPATEKTKNLPRPVFNIVRFILNHKIASVANESIKMSFSPEEVMEQDEQPTATGMMQKAYAKQNPGQPPLNFDPNQQQDPLQQAQEGADKFTKFSDSTWEQIKQDELNEDFLDDAATTGTGILHYYWDDSTKGGIKTLHKGDMTGETLDPINVFFGNPQQRNVQKQPRIIISGRELVSVVKAEAKDNNVKVEDIAMITADKNTTDEGYDGAQKEPTDSQKTTILTSYERKTDGLVYLTKVCSGITYKPEISTDFTLYPLVTMPWEKRKKAINGVSEAEGIIPNQKSINFIIAMMLLSVQDTAWPKILAKEGALQQQITNTPGEIIIDYNMQGTDGIKYMQTGNINQMAPLIVDKVMEFTRTLTGASEVSTGDPFTKDLNAAAIIAMQNAAKIPIEQIKRRFYRAMEDVGRVWEQFYKSKYVTNRNVTVKDDDGKPMPMQFKGSDYAEVPMKLKIDIGASSSFSESLMMSSLDKFLDKQYIDFKTYLTFVPANVVPFKDRLLKIVEQKEQEAQMMAEQQAQQQAMQPQGMPQQGLSVEEIMELLTPEEQAMVEANPELLQQAMQGQQGPPMMG